MQGRCWPLCSQRSPCRYLIIYQRQLYRIFTGTVFHAGITHIAMNMLSLQAMGTSLVRCGLHGDGACA